MSCLCIRTALWPLDAMQTSAGLKYAETKIDAPSLACPARRQGTVGGNLVSLLANNIQIRCSSSSALKLCQHMRTEATNLRTICYARMG